MGSGQTAAEFFGWDFTNLSCPLPAEGYVNFGILGVVVFAVHFSLIVSKADNVFWRGRSVFMKIVYPFVVPFVFFLMRGDLLSSFAYLFGFAVTVWGVYFVNRLFLREERLRKRRRRAVARAAKDLKQRRTDAE